MAAAGGQLRRSSWQFQDQTLLAWLIACRSLPSTKRLGCWSPRSSAGCFPSGVLLQLIAAVLVFAASHAEASGHGLPAP